MEFGLSLQMDVKQEEVAAKVDMQEEKTEEEEELMITFMQDTDTTAGEIEDDAPVGEISLQDENNNAREVKKIIYQLCTQIKSITTITLLISNYPSPLRLNLCFFFLTNLLNLCG